MMQTVLITTGTVIILCGLWFGAIYWANSKDAPYDHYDPNDQ